jgi:predicted CoA-substrate-specific enzyme activase
VNYVGIDIGSTASKVVVTGDNTLQFVLPTGWSSKETTILIKEKLLEENIDVLSDDTKVVSTGYGRAAVEFADFVITEITCHARGGRELAGDDCSIIDVGGQDTKVILVSKGMVQDFQMNDKCSAGTGKFLEIMANRLGITLQELFEMAEKGNILPISSLCTVFAESEVINYIGEGCNREDIAAGVVDSVVAKVAQLGQRKQLSDNIILTGGLSHSAYFAKSLSDKVGKTVRPVHNGRFAGALGAALLAREKSARSAT